MISETEFLELYVMFCKTISKPARLRIIHLIGNGKMNVSTIQKELDIPLSNLSNHLNDLYRVGILSKEKQGNFVFYYLTDPELVAGVTKMQQIVKNINQKKTL